MRTRFTSSRSTLERPSRGRSSRVSSSTRPWRRVRCSISQSSVNCLLTKSLSCSARSDPHHRLQPQAGQHARRKVFRHGPLRTARTSPFSIFFADLGVRRPRQRRARREASSLSTRQQVPSLETVFTSKASRTRRPLTCSTPRRRFSRRCSLVRRSFFFGPLIADSMAVPPIAGFTTLDSREAAWVSPEGAVHKIVTAKGVCAPKTLVGASLS